MEGSKLYQILGIFSIAFAVCYGQKEGMSLSAESIVVRQEGDIVLKCSFEDGVYVPGQYIQWIKYGLDSEEGGVKFAVQSDIEDNFKSLLPGSSIATSLENGVHFTLTIKSAKVGFSGFYGCLSKDGRDGVDVEKKVQIQVLHEPTEIGFYVEDEEITTDSEIELDGFEDMRIRCRASGGNPAPEIRLFAGADMDITDQFGRKAFTEEMVNSDACHDDAFCNRVWTATFEDDLEVTSQYSHKQLFCEAYTEGLEEKTLTSNKYRITFAGTPPEITCSQLTLVRKPNEESVSINCTVSANPPLDEGVVVFHRIGNVNETVTLTQTESYGRNMHLVTKTDPTDPHLTVMTLTIDQLFPQMFRTYTFKATNSIGSASVNVQVERGEVGQRTDSAMTTASCLGNTIILALVALVFSL